MFLKKVTFPICLLLSSSVIAKGFLPESFTATFEQSHKSAIHAKVSKTYGSVDYKFPGNIRFETSGDDKIVFVSNKTKTWYYTSPFIEGEPGELTINPSGKNALSRFFDVLKKGLKTNKLYSVKKKELGHELSFSKKTSKEIGLQSAVIKFKEKKLTFKNITSLTLIYNDDKKVSLALSAIKLNTKMANSHFIFEAPENTKINK